MIDLYSWQTSNGRKASIMLEELAIPYRVYPVNIEQGDQFKPDFTQINPNSKIPAIVDQDGPCGRPYTVFESGAILMYLAEKNAQLMPTEVDARYQVIQWLMLQMGGIGPMFGQCHHFRFYASEHVPYAIERFTKETKRLYRVLDHRLAKREYLAGDRYSIADVATFPWVFRHNIQSVDLDEFPNVKRWYHTVHARPAVQRGMYIPQS